MSNADWMGLTTGATCIYGDDPETDCAAQYAGFDWIDPVNLDDSYGEYGRLYNWYAAQDPRGLQPLGLGEYQPITKYERCSKLSVVKKLRDST